MTEPIKTVGRAILCDFPNGDKLLVGEIEIACPACGEGQWRIAGHHMRSVMRILAEWVEQYPDLTGPEQPASVERTTWKGTAPSDPSQN